MRPAERKFKVRPGGPREWWVVWTRPVSVIVGPYRVRRSARYVAGLLNEVIENEPLGATF